MILCSGEFPIVDAARARRSTAADASHHAGVSSRSQHGQTDRGKPPPVLGAHLVYAMWWIAFGASVLQSACS